MYATQNCTFNFLPLYLLFNIIVNCYIFFIGKRNLYERAAIGLDKYDFFRDKVDNQFSDTEKQLFRDRMKSFADLESNNLIFTEDLKQIVHMIGNNEEDLTLVQQMMKKYITSTYFYFKLLNCFCVYFK